MPKASAVVLKSFKPVWLHFEHGFICFLGFNIFAHFKIASCYLALHPSSSLLLLWQLFELLDGIWAMEISHQLDCIADLPEQSNEISSTLLWVALHCALLNLQEVCSDTLGCRAILATLGITICNEIGIHMVRCAYRERLNHWISDNVLLIEKRLVRHLGIWSLGWCVRRVHSRLLMDWFTVSKTSTDYLLLVFIRRMELKLVGHWHKTIDHP